MTEPIQLENKRGITDTTQRKWSLRSWRGGEMVSTGKDTCTEAWIESASTANNQIITGNWVVEDVGVESKT